MTAVRIAAMLAALSIAAACGSAATVTTGAVSQPATAAGLQPGWDMLDASYPGLLRRFDETATCDSAVNCLAP